MEVLENLLSPQPLSDQPAFTKIRAWQVDSDNSFYLMKIFFGGHRGRHSPGLLCFVLQTVAGKEKKKPITWPSGLPPCAVAGPSLNCLWLLSCRSLALCG